MTRRPPASAAALTLALALPGCVVDEINQGIAKSNENVQQTNADLDIVTDRMAEIDGELVRINEQLAVLTSIDASLKKLDEHLASLRKTINNIDSTIPFLKLSGDDKEDTEALENTDPAAPADPEK